MDEGEGGGGSRIGKLSHGGQLPNWAGHLS